VAYYEINRIGLGLELLAEIRRIIKRMTENPRQFPRIARGIRRARVNRFPYGNVYSIQADQVWILAVMHLSRKPGYWKYRVRK
jgi:toxin ParE1/3/4